MPAAGITKAYLQLSALQEKEKEMNTAAETKAAALVETKIENKMTEAERKGAEKKAKREAAKAAKLAKEEADKLQAKEEQEAAKNKKDKESRGVEMEGKPVKKVDYLALNALEEAGKHIEELLNFSGSKVLTFLILLTK